MNDVRLTRILKNRAAAIKGCVVSQGIFERGGDVLGFRVEADTGAIFEVRVTVYKDAVQ